MLPTLSVAENIFIDSLPSAGPFVRTGEWCAVRARLLARLG